MPYRNLMLTAGPVFVAVPANGISCAVEIKWFTSSSSCLLVGVCHEPSNPKCRCNTWSCEDVGIDGFPTCLGIDIDAWTCWGVVVDGWTILCPSCSIRMISYCPCRNSCFHTNYVREWWCTRTLITLISICISVVSSSIFLTLPPIFCPS